jgi:acetyl esterase/lipase
MQPAAKADALKNPQVIPVWPATAPGSAGLKLIETVVDRSTDPARPDRVVTGVSNPTLTAFLPAKPNGASLIVAPGGGYVRQVTDKEGNEIARRFNGVGVTVFVLTYRLPSEGHQNAADVPVQDAQRAVRRVRASAAKWKLDPARVAFMGFSAGGHLASSLATRFAAKTYEPVDRADSLSARPDAVILMYPVTSMDDAIAHQGSRNALLGQNPGKDRVVAYSTELHVASDSPPTLLVVAGDDPLVVHSLRYYQALLAAKVPAELHVFMQGGHGFALRLPQDHPTASWPELARGWLGAVGMAR